MKNAPQSRSCLSFTLLLGSLIPKKSSKQSTGQSENTVQWLREDGVESGACCRGSQRQLTGFNAQPAQTQNTRRSIRDARTSSKTCEWRITENNLTVLCIPMYCQRWKEKLWLRKQAIVRTEIFAKKINDHVLFDWLRQICNYFNLYLDVLISGICKSTGVFFIPQMVTLYKNIKDGWTLDEDHGKIRGLGIHVVIYTSPFPDIHTTAPIISVTPVYSC